MVESNYVPFQYISLRHEYDAIYIAHLSDNRIDRLHVYKFTQSSFIHFNPLLFTMPILCPYIFRLQFSIFPPKGIFSIWLVNMWRTSNQVDELPFPSNVSRQIFKIFTILVFYQGIYYVVLCPLDCIFCIEGYAKRYEFRQNR